jgi:MFS family permease
MTLSEPTPATVETPRRLGLSYHKLFWASVVSNLGDGMATIAYPWLASAVTRDPLLVALVLVAQRLPWLIFTLPAGVITDRVDRRKVMVLMDSLRAVLTLVVAFAVLGNQGSLPGPKELDTVVGTRTGLYLLVLIATLLLGSAEVLRDNSAQTLMPNLVHPTQLEKANGRLWSIEAITNTFVGPPLGSILLLGAFSLPFFVDAGTFFVSAALLALIPGVFRAERAPDADVRSTSFRSELAEGVRWLMGHSLLRPMAIILGLMNAATAASGATFVLYSQEVLGIGPFLFSILTLGGAVGGLVGGNVASFVSRRFGSGTCLAAVLLISTLTAVVTALVASWPVVMLMFTVTSLVGILWNVITVSLRQTIIPPHLLGRVNSVYRFFAWGMMPIGAAVGGATVAVVSTFASRGTALRATWMLDAAIHAVLFIVGRRKLTTDKIEAARAVGAATASAS